MPISTLAQTQQVIQNLASLQTQSNTLEQQISTGLVSQSYAGIAPQAAQLVSLSAQQSQQQGYHQHHQHGEHAALDHEPRHLDDGEPGPAIRAATSDQRLQHHRRDHPIAGAGAARQGRRLSQYRRTAKATCSRGARPRPRPMSNPACPTPGDLTTSVSGAPPAGYYAGNNDVASAQVDSHLNVSYGVTADNPAFEQVVRVLNFLANAPPFDQNNTTDQSRISARPRPC